MTLAGARTSSPPNSLAAKPFAKLNARSPDLSSHVLSVARWLRPFRRGEASLTLLPAPAGSCLPHFYGARWQMPLGQAPMRLDRTQSQVGFVGRLMNSAKAHHNTKTLNSPEQSPGIHSGDGRPMINRHRRRSAARGISRVCRMARTIAKSTPQGKRRMQAVGLIRQARKEAPDAPTRNRNHQRNRPHRFYPRPRAQAGEIRLAIHADPTRDEPADNGLPTSNSRTPAGKFGSM